MIFFNRYDQVQMLESLDESELDTYELSRDNWVTSIHLKSSDMIGKYRYMTVNQRLYLITDYSRDESGTEVTAFNFVSKKAEDMTVNQGTYTLENLLNKINEVVVTLNNATMPEIIITEDDKGLYEAIDECINQTNYYISVETVLNSDNRNGGLNMYYTRVSISGIGWGAYNKADVILAIDEYDNSVSSNPQYDLARRLRQEITGIDNISHLKTWKPIMAAADYNLITDYIENGDSPTTDKQVSDVLMKYLSFKRGAFDKVQGKIDIINNSVTDDSVSYKLNDVNFAPYTVLKNQVIQNIFNQYQGYTINNIEILPDVRCQMILGVNNDEMYIAQSYTVDCRNFIVGNADFILINTLEEFPDERN